MRLTTLVLAVALASVSVAHAQVARIRGTVKTDQGEPIKGAVVTARNAGTQPNEFTSTTNDKGDWAMLGLRAGIWSVVVVADGFEAARGDVRVSSFDRNRSFDFILARTPLGGPARKLDAADIQADLQKADAFAEEAKWDEAVDAYQAILLKVPALTSVYLPLGRACREAGNYDEAVSAFKAYLDAHAGSQVALLELGRTHLAAGDRDAAATALARAIETDPSTAHASTARTLLDQIK